MTELKSCPFCGETRGKHKDNCYIAMIVQEWKADWREIPLYTEDEIDEAWNTRFVDGDTSDGYHTFNELYHHRAVLFSKVVQFAGDKAWKSKLHADGTMYDGYFIVGVETPEGQVTYHYEIDNYWEMFDCKEVDKAPFWDGHTPQDAIGRVERWNTSAEQTCEYDYFQSAKEANWGSAVECQGYHVLKCGHRVPGDYFERPNYCCVCGVKVVE